MTRLLAAAVLWPALLLSQTTALDVESSGELPGVKLTGLTAAQKAQVLAIARQEDCTCQCGMKIAPCIARDPNCMTSKTLATAVAGALKAGKTPVAARAVLKDAAYIAKLKEEIENQPANLNLAGVPAAGPEKARVTIVEFSDFQCPFCRGGAEALAAVAKAFPNDVRVVFKQFPLESHSQAAIAAEASLAAHAQGKFWPMHDRIFANPRSLTEENLMAWAKEMGLDAGRFAQELTGHKYRSTVRREVREGIEAGVQGTPTVFLNGRIYRGQLNMEALKPAIEAELKRR
ncbi:MAG: DsbA family protein [Bryobacterales bacterium]|nr:DsbA family protein [Bryobacterales bacterium]